MESAGLYAELLAASQKLSSRCLYQAAKWAAEAADGLGLGDDAAYEPPQTNPFLQPDPVSSKITMAVSYFACREYFRAAHVLQHVKTPQAIFLRLYSLYIAAEKSKEEELEGIMGPRDNHVTNSQIASILAELDDSPHTGSDPFLLYLHGVAHLQAKNTTEARSKLVKSLQLFPYNWSAWQELLSCVETLDELKTLEEWLPDLNHPMTRIFLIHARQEMYLEDSETVGAIERLKSEFPEFLFLQTEHALYNYRALNYEEAEEQFDTVLAKDPYRLDDLDIYSNILYVMERGAKLSYLAQIANKTDKFRPETCCILGNFYSLNSQHERAIVYYQRALLLDRTCLSAWTLMGHEFIELKNANAAIESYRRAVDTNSRDYRAWYGLGQAYELHEMPYYSLYYFQRAAALKPMDVRIWLALADCYEKLGRFEEAIKAYKRASRVSDMDADVLHKIATLYEELKDVESASTFMKLCVAEEVSDGLTPTIIQARLWLARKELVLGNWKKAASYAEQVTTHHGTTSDEAREILREARSRLRRDEF